ncbi:hypothetical protein ONV78_21255 [Hahella sp. CR1]|uniref:DUF6916 family protein n=1 Tax=Hahella sp. CR1 TaxID=2992807 RepID=UPI00244335B6|nr:hypothetical protein [Hahella sp. CR1]MDG9670280.1 hypothetical protein [Hahella sp. CR1]
MFTHDQFQSNQDKTFYATYDSNQPPLELTLVEVSDKKELGGGFESFSVIFKAGKDKGLMPQQTCAVKNDNCGAHDIFIVPVAEKDDCYLYESVFSYKVGG